MQFFNLETDLLVVLDEQGNIARVNPAFEQTLGYREANVLGVSLISLVSVNDWAAFIKSFNAPHPPVFRLLHSVSGESEVRLVAARFRQGRGFLVMRTVDD